MIEPLQIDPPHPADACVIWLHGLGANCYDFEPVARRLQARIGTLRFIFPQAPTCPVTVNGGLSMPSWYDILAMSPTSRAINEHDIEASGQRIVSLIEAQEHLGVAPTRIFLAGFSQGGAVVLHTTYCMLDHTIGGVVALSTYGPTLGSEHLSPPERVATPALFMHGSRDNVVTLPFGRIAHDRLQARGIDARWEQYDIDHEVTLTEINVLGEWLTERLC